jgi:hypothetical protein
VLSAWWNLRTTFVRFPIDRRFDNRDFIVRLAADLDRVQTIANFGAPEYFEHQAYQALVPEARGMNLNSTPPPGEDLAAVVKALGPRTLVVYPPDERTFRDLCNHVGGDLGGTVDTSSGETLFEWCWVE